MDQPQVSYFFNASLSLGAATAEGGIALSTSSLLKNKAKKADMPKVIKIYVRYTEAMSKAVGKFSMYLVIAIGGVLLFESLSRTFFNRPHIWVVETAQFLMVAYYLLGGGYSDILDSHVRMDLLYGRWSAARQALSDVLTFVLLFLYMVFLLVGGIYGIKYAIKYNQTNYTPWGPPLAPIKIIMAIGILLMLLQLIATFFKDLAKVMGKDLAEDNGETTT
jgi:TRAP-type mannitol/chloroaromatic compound transport system permease small subunit